jgi:hypothetical protein
MPNLRYNSGRRLEWRVRDYYKDRGFEVFRSAGSKSPADLICISSGFTLGNAEVPQVILVQCKTGAKLMSERQRKEFRDFCYKIKCEGKLAYRNGRKLVIVDV